ncbi:MAG TPA: TonB-dependent receptor [Pyrinomonadaceae bacterium]|jgi:hypothetical protein
MLSLSLRSILCGLFILWLVAPASAQFRAGVQGTVTDPAGAVVPGATVTLVSQDTTKSQQTTASDSGFYRFSNLAPGTYTLTAEQAGFKKQVIENLIVNAENVEGVDIKLETGIVTETVTVQDESTPALETENANITKALTTEEIRRLPQFGRDPYELTRLTPGVFGEGARGGAGGAQNLPNSTGPGGSNRAIFQTENQVQISANGQRVSANNYQIDGTSVNSLTHGGAAVITPNQESVREVRVIANTYSAEFGRNSGAQILAVSQNGTNDFHGSLFLKNNSPGLNSFNKYGGINNAPPVRVEQRINQFGGSLGGPIYLPRFGEGGRSVYSGKNRAFFFISYEGLRSNSTNTTVPRLVETAQYRALVQQLRPGSVTAAILGAQGVAPRIASVLNVTCAQAGIGGPCQQVPGGLDIGSPAGATGQYLSFGNLEGGGLDGIPDVLMATFASPNVSRGNQYNARLDFNINTNNTLAISMYRTRFRGTQGDADGRARPMADVTTEPANTFGTLTYTRVLSATMVNEARINATRFAFNEIESSDTTNFGIPRIEIETLPGDRIRFGAPYSETTPGIFAENTFEFRDTLRKIAGDHALSFGAEIRKEQDNNNLIGGARPLFTFGGLFNFANSTPLFYQINADPRTGGPPATQRYFRSNTYAFFAQDDWKFRPNVTFNLGLRYEYFTPLRETEGRLSNFVLGTTQGQELTGGRIVTGSEFYPPDRNNFAPRLGFAYSPRRFDDKLVLRGGFGIAYNRLPVVLFANARGNPPFQARYTICCGTSAQDFQTPFAGGQILYALGANNTPFSYPANPALRITFNPTTGLPVNQGAAQLEVYGAPAQVPTPYIYTYSLEGQYSLPMNLTAEVGYQGSASRKLLRLVNQRFLYPNDPGNFFASAIFFPTPDTTASYNALLLRLSRRFSNGVQFDGNYRWSKSIDVVSSEEIGAPTNPTYPLDPKQERGPSDYDVRHSLTASGLWDLPFFRTRKDAVGKILGGWQINGILTYHTGFPWTPVIGNCPSSNRPIICPARPTAYFGGAGTSSSNDAFINGSNFPGGGTKFFSTVGATGAAGTPVAGLLPGIGRNSFRGPRYFNVDMSTSKRFGMPSFLGEGAFFEIKANFFNIFNILNLQSFGFNTSSTQITDPNFGRAERGLAGRVVEIQGRFSF